MQNRQLRKVFRERRRLALVVILVVSALHLSGFAATSLPLPAVAFALLAAGLAGLLAVMVPRARRVPVMLALAGLGFAGFMRALPGSLLDLSAPDGAPQVAVAVFLGLSGLVGIARWHLAAWPGPRLPCPRFRARATTGLDIYRLWNGLLPTPAVEARDGDTELIAIEEMSPRLSPVRLLTRAAPEPKCETHLQILEIDAPFHVRLRACEADPRGVMAATGVSEIFLVELGPHRLVLFSHEFPDLPIGRALLAWIDDTPGRILDRRLAGIEQRARSEDAGAHADPRTIWDADSRRDTAQKRSAETDTWRGAG